MKNTDRARKKHRANQLPKQVQPKTERTVTVALFGPALRDRVEFPKSLFSKVKSACKEFGITPQEFFKQAITEKISREITRQSSMAVTTALAWNGGAR